MQSAYDAYQEGNRLLASQNPHAAVIALERARDLEPDKASVRETLARLYYRSGRFAEAGEEFERAVEIEPVNDYAHFGLGLCLMRRGDRIGARRHLKLAVAMRPDQSDYRAALARVWPTTRDAPMTLPPVVACDLDGVVWRGDEPIPPAAPGIAALREAGLRVAFVSNNSNSPVGDVVAKLDRMGIPADAADVVTSAMAAAWLLQHSLAPGSRVLVCGGPGVREALIGAGLQPVDERPADAVVVGFHREFDYDALDRASHAVRDGARFVATNLDATYPMPGGLIPGAGALVAAVATAAGATPEVAGKPEAPTVGLIRERYGDTGLVVGDRPSTDGVLADALGWPFALVLSGVTAAVAPPGGEAIPEPAPPFVGTDLGALAPSLITALHHG